MAQMADAGPAGPPDLELDPAAVLDLARDTRTTADEVAGDTTFRRLRLEGTSLGGFDAAAAVVAAHRSAHAVVSETILGVKEDLEAFSGYLRDAVAGIEDADHLSSGALGKLAAIRIGSEGDRANLRARTKYVEEPPAPPAPSDA